MKNILINIRKILYVLQAILLIAIIVFVTLEKDINILSLSFFSLVLICFIIEMILRKKI